MAKAWRVRPSELYCVDDPLEAFRFDRAVFLFGTALTSELDKQEGKTAKETDNKRQAVFKKWMPRDSGPAQQRFKDPSSR